MSQINQRSEQIKSELDFECRLQGRDPAVVLDTDETYPDDQVLARTALLAGEARRADWRQAVTVAVAGIVCGLLVVLVVIGIVAVIMGPHW
jgi:hypothetical protein